MAILPQTLPAPAVSVAELAVFGRNPYLDFGRRMTPTDRRLVEEALERVGIAALRDKLLTELSGGERQKAYLAMILAQDTDVLLLDEPTTYMDMEYEAAFFRLLKALQAEKGVTLLVILHDLSQAMRYADRIVVLDAGRVRFAGDTRPARPAAFWKRCSASGSGRSPTATGNGFFSRPRDKPRRAADANAADRRGKGRRTHQTHRQARRGPARREAAPQQTVPVRRRRTRRPRGRPKRVCRRQLCGGRPTSTLFFQPQGQAALAATALSPARKPAAAAGAASAGGLMRMRGIRP